MRLRFMALMLAGAVLAVGSAEAVKAPQTWDGLVQVKSKRLEMVYLQPGADFRGYTKVIVEPVEVAFHKNWQRQYNQSSRLGARRISDREVQNAVAKGIAASTGIFTDAFTKNGYQVVTEPGPDVLRVNTGIINIVVIAPDTRSTGVSRTYSSEAGQATLFVEARDSLTGAILGRAVDRRYVGDNIVMNRTDISNRADFRRQAEEWAKVSVRGLNELKARSPVR